MWGVLEGAGRGSAIVGRSGPREKVKGGGNGKLWGNYFKKKNPMVSIPFIVV